MSASGGVLAEQQLLLAGPPLLAGYTLLTCGSARPGRWFAAPRHRYAHLRPGTPHAGYTSRTLGWRARNVNDRDGASPP
jgi:hypothetical protein